MKKEKWIALCPLLFFCCASMPFKEKAFDSVSSSLDLYSFDKSATADIGAVYHYEKSNIDGSSKADVWIYIASETRTESFKIYPSTKLQGRSDLVIADYDFKIMSAAEINAYFVNSKGERTLNAKAFTADGKKYEFIIGKQKQSVDAGNIPSFNYNFDWCDLGFTYRHIADKKTRFETGVIVPNSQLKMIYAGKCSFEYRGIENFKGYDCYKYEISGEAFNEKSGNLFADSNTGIIIEINMPLRNNPGYNSFLFTLVDKFNFTNDEWNDFILSETKKVIG